VEAMTEESDRSPYSVVDDPVLVGSRGAVFPFYVKEISHARRCSRASGEQWRNNNVKADRHGAGIGLVAASFPCSLFSRAIIIDTRENLRVASSQHLLRVETFAGSAQLHRVKADFTDWNIKLYNFVKTSRQGHERQSKQHTPPPRFSLKLRLY